MKTVKHILTSVFLVLGLVSFAQVGVGTQNPSTTFEAVGANATDTGLTGANVPGALTAADGVTIPRVTTDMTGSPLDGTSPSQLVYSTFSTKEGYYFWDGDSWEPIEGDGKFVDGTDPLNAIYTGGDVGIGIAAPTDDLHVNGDVRITGTLKDASNSAGTASQVFSSTATGTAWVDAASILPTGTQSGNTLYFDGTDWVENTNLVHNEYKPVIPSPVITHAGSILNGASGALLNNPRSVAISGNYAFVAASGSNAIEVVDISNPTTPVHATSIISGSPGPELFVPFFITISGNYAYVTSYYGMALSIIDISDPLNPTHAGIIHDGDGGALLSNPYGVAVSGNFAYVTASGDDAIEVVNISDPTNPTHAASISHGGAILLDNPRDIAISGNIAYVASLNSDAIEIINITNPNNPSHAGSIVNGAGGALLDGPISVKISGDYAYVASLNSNALEIINIANPLSPTHTGSISHGGSTLLNGANNVFIYENYAFVTANTSNAIEVVDISNPANPTHITSISNGAGGALLDGPYHVEISGNYAYVAAANSSDALEVLDVSDFTAKVQGVGIGTATPTAQLHTTGTVRFENFGAGTLQTDANGNLSVSSDERLKNTVSEFEKGLKEILALKPINYRWNALSGLEQEELYIGFSAQNVQSVLPEAVGQDQKGYLTLSDRPILAATVNAIKELNAKNEALEAENKKLKALLEHVLKRLKKLEE